MNAVIRPEGPADFTAIRALVADAFGSADEADLVDAIRESEHYIAELALVAEIGGRVVGHVMISGATLRAGATDHRVLVLAPIAVAPPEQGVGIGSALVRAATASADSRGEPLIVLEGSPAFYGRFGFEPAYEHGIEIAVPDWAPPEAGQVLRLSSYDASLTGRVVYPAPFDIVAE